MGRIGTQYSEARRNSLILLPDFDNLFAGGVIVEPAHIKGAACRRADKGLFLFTLLTDTDLQTSITKATGSAAQTKTRWTKFRVDELARTVREFESKNRSARCVGST
jgi:hypothetical protein